MGYQLVMIRHGESVWNQKNLFTGWTDVDLSETGHKEAAQGGVLLKEAGFSFDVCYTSYLQRAIHTANHVLQELRMDSCYQNLEIKRASLRCSAGSQQIRNC